MIWSHKKKKPTQILFFFCKDHYDWGLRAIKSVLVVAGSLKREDRSRPEAQVGPSPVCLISVPWQHLTLPFHPRC